MLANANFPEATIVRRPKAKLSTKARERRRQMALEALESRTLLALAYTFSFDALTNTATVSPNGAPSGAHSLVIEPVAGFLEYSVDGSIFSGAWTNVNAPPPTISVPAAPTTTVDITLVSGDHS